jgi:threonine synthase
MAAALSFLKYLIRRKGLDRDFIRFARPPVITSPRRTLYASYLSGARQISGLAAQGQGHTTTIKPAACSGARVFELPGVFDDCMKVVEHLADNNMMWLCSTPKTPGGFWTGIVFV